MKRIVITGSTGLIGSYLVKQLRGEYNLILLTRNPDRYINTESVQYIYWDGKSIITDIVNDSYAIINLIGENIGLKNWNPKQRKLILNSRTDAAQAIQKSVELSEIKPRVWIQASATGFYGQSQTATFDESSPKGQNSFLANVCEEWERPIREVKNENIRKIIVRTGVVLAKNSDLWKQLNQSFLFGVAAIVGNGRQVVPWIHIDDEVGAILYLLRNDELSGVYNLVAPTKISMTNIISAIKSKKMNFITLHIPRWFLLFIFGKDKTDELVLTNQHIVPKKLLENKFEFKYVSISDVIKTLN